MLTGHFQHLVPSEVLPFHTKLQQNEVLWVTPKGELEAMELTSCGFYPPWLSVADNELEVEIAPD